MTRRLLKAVCIAALLLGLVVQGAAPALAASPQQCAIHLSDLRAGYVQTASKYLRPTHHGQIGGYETVFKRNVFFDVALIQDDVYAYRSAAYAHAGYLRAVAGMRTSHPFKHSAWQAMSAGRLGEERQAVEISGKASGWSLTYALLVFRQGSMIADVVVGGVAGFDTGKIGDLAGLIDRRMRG